MSHAAASSLKISQHKFTDNAYIHERLRIKCKITSLFY